MIKFTVGHTCPRQHFLVCCALMLVAETVVQVLSDLQALSTSHFSSQFCHHCCDEQPHLAELTKGESPPLRHLLPSSRSFPFLLPTMGSLSFFTAPHGPCAVVPTHPCVCQATGRLHRKKECRALSRAAGICLPWVLIWVSDSAFLLFPHRSTLRYGSLPPSLGFSSLCCCLSVKCYRLTPMDQEPSPGPHIHTSCCH